MLEGMVPYFKRALVVAVVLCAFFTTAQFTLAQVTLNPDGSISRPTLPQFRPTLPNNPTPDTEPPIFPGDVGELDPGTGRPISGVPVDPVTGQPIPGEQTTQTEESPALRVDHGSCQWDSVQGGLYCLVISGFGSLASIAGWLFDFAVREFIIGFGTLYLNTGVGVILENLWGTVRDIFNLTFIFGLVYIGFQIILGVNEAGAKRTIPYLILAALLVNFSLFIVKFIIDFTNYAAAQIYGLFQTENINTDGVDISRAFLNAIDFSNILGASGQDAPFMLIIGTLFLFLVLFYVFLSGAILIMIRFIALCFYMIFSPIMFLGWVFPGMGSYTKDFWRGLLGQAFFAPALLFLLYLSISVIIQFQTGFRLTLTADNVGEGGSVKTVTTFLNLVPFFVLSIGFIIASLVVAKKIGFTGGGMAIAMAEKGRSWVQGKAIGATAFAGQRTLGAGANALKDSAMMRRMAANSFVGKGIYNATRKVSDASFDVRNSGVSASDGKAYKGGYKTRQKEAEKRESEFLESLGTKKDSDPQVAAAIANKKQAEAALVARQQQLYSETQVDRDQIVSLRQRYNEVTTDAEREAIALQITAMETSIKTAEKNAEKQLSTLKAAADKADKDVVAAQYSYQTTYNDKVQAWNKWLNKTTTTVGAAASFAAVGVLTGGLVPAAVAGSATAAGLTSLGYSRRKVNKAMKDEYGEDGTKKKAKKQEKDRIKALAEEVTKETEKK